MGCGASGGGGGGKKYEEKLAASETKQEDIHADSKSMKRHKEHCTDKDLKMAKTIAEAYPFTEEDRKIISKKEKVFHGADGRRHDWGNVSVAKMQSKVHCNVCKGYILDKYETKQFYFCMRCRRDSTPNQDHHFELCLQCFDEGALYSGMRNDVNSKEAAHGGDRTATWGLGGLSCDSPTHDTNRRLSGQPVHDANSHRLSGSMAVNGLGRSPQSSPQGSPRPAGSQRPSLTGPLGSPRPGSPRPRSASPRPSAERISSLDMPPMPQRRASDPNVSPRASPRNLLQGPANPHASVPSGLWRGKVTEGASSRPVDFQLFYDKSGQIVGSGPDGCSVQGTMEGRKVSWKETHSWGAVQVIGSVFEDKFVRGKFTNSDGGGGTINLSHQVGRHSVG